MTFQLRRIHEHAKIPSRRDGDVGYDIYTCESVVLKARSTSCVNTGLLLAHTSRFSTFLKVEGRSGLARDGIFPVGGIIDPTYRGEIIIVMYNSTDTDREFERGAKIAQLVPYQFVNVGCISETANEPTDTVRGANGFGSTG